MTRTEVEVVAYLIIGIGYHYGQTFNKTPSWNIPLRWVMVVAFWPGVVIANAISAIAAGK